MGLANTAGGYESGWQSSWTNDLSPAKTGWDGDLQACDSGYTTWTPAAATTGTGENMPINCIDWYDAYAFCIWDGGFLPSEAEWEFAAAGGSEMREYPWGNTFADDGTFTAFKYAISNCSYPDFTGPFMSPCAGTQNIAVVGYTYLGAAKWGQLDLAGNVIEWNLDTYAPYQSCTDCANVSSNSMPVLRGGGYNGVETDMEPEARDSVSPATWRFESIGARCARSP
jgi:formylglycine-generating enzyme required for sulfatase activity